MKQTEYTKPIGMPESLFRFLRDLKDHEADELWLYIDNDNDLLIIETIVETHPTLQEKFIY